jgi:hypothetical protein
VAVSGAGRTSRCGPHETALTDSPLSVAMNTSSAMLRAGRRSDVRILMAAA